MKMAKPRKSALSEFALSAAVVLVLVVVTHLAWSATVAALADHLYPSRMFDVTRFDDGSRQANSASSAITAHYLRRNVSATKAVLIGSSFSFGYPSDRRFALDAHLERHGVPILNVSWIGKSLAGIHQTLCALHAEQLHPAAVLVEIPLVNEVGSLSQPQSPLECYPTSKQSLFMLIAGRPFGLGWLRFVFDPFADSIPNEKPSIARVPDSYFASPSQFETISARLRENIFDVAARARVDGHNPIMFVTPVFLEGAQEAGGDKLNIGAQFDYAERVCREAVGDRCVTTRSMLHEGSYYSNITHLNDRGAEALAALLLPALRSTMRAGSVE